MDAKEKSSSDAFRSELENNLTGMAKKMKIEPHDFRTILKMPAYDCYLYARDDKYKS